MTTIISQRTLTTSLVSVLQRFFVPWAIRNDFGF
jgi:hypothetical protein